MRVVVSLVVFSIVLMSAAGADTAPTISKRFDCKFSDQQESLAINIHPINFEKDPKKPALMGSISSVKITIGPKTTDATPIHVEQQRVAVVTS